MFTSTPSVKDWRMAATVSLVSSYSAILLTIINGTLSSPRNKI